MNEQIIKIIKDAEQQRHNNHIKAGKMNWEQIRLDAKKEVFDDIWNTWAKKYGDNHTSSEAIFDMHDMLRELEKRHLSTLPKDECNFCAGTGYPKGQSCVDLKKRQSNLINAKSKS